MGRIPDPDKFTLRGLVRSFNELFQNQPGGLMSVLKVSHNQVKNMTEAKNHSEILMFIDQVRYQAESNTDIGMGISPAQSIHGINSCQLDIVLNNLEQFICTDMSKEAYDEFIRLFTSSERSSLTELARLKMAK